MSAQVGKVAQQVVQQKRVSAFVRWWILTRDLPELWVVYGGVGLALCASGYTITKTYFYDKSGSYLDPDIRGDPMKQEESNRVGGGRNAEKVSLFWRLAQVKNTKEGPDIAVSPFSNYAVSRYNEPAIERPGHGAPRAGAPDAEKTRPLVG